jgi:Ca2+-binding RTX toxin-like protein
MTYTGALKDDSGRGLLYKTFLIGTDAQNTIDANANTTQTERDNGLTIMGGAGSDTLTGSTGSDLIIGGLGSDVLRGGGGSDTFMYNAERLGTGAAGGMGGQIGDTITDFNFGQANAADADRLDISQLFDASFTATGNAATDAARLTSGGYVSLFKAAGKNDLEVWVDRDGGGVMGLLATITGAYDNFPTHYLQTDTSQQMLERLLGEGRFVVQHA